ncbi:MAG: hypothetical protein JRI25_15020 [Deltaproteobacteria bacterium]|nr:hypothetical protein [Deltaproteobacteria bacterium]
MFVRTTRIRRGDKTYEYPQLVESYRQKNGQPTHRVIASLKDWSPQAIENLKLALVATKDGATLVAAERSAEQVAVKHLVIANLAFLPVAVLAALWERWQLSKLLDQLLPSSSIVSHSQVIQALVLHRCVAPGSKLSACSWYPTTALPELLGVKARYFNNSRVHRALHALSEVEGAVQKALAQRVSLEKDGVVVTYLDLTDTWFVGRGPELSRKGKTKEGLYREKVGIALLCDQRGFPLRWKTVMGGRYEPAVMLEVVREAVEAGVIEGQPVVMDRAMGRGAHLEALTDAGVAFLTALVRSEFASFVDDGPWGSFDEVELSGSPRTRKRDLARLGQLAHEAGMKPLPDGRFFKDFGVARCERDETKPPPDGQGPLAELLREVAFMEEALATGLASSNLMLADWYGISSRGISRYRRLTHLAEDVRARALRGEAEPLHIDELREIAGLPHEEQGRAFDTQLADIASQQRNAAKPPKILDLRRRSLLLRRVGWFSPDLFLRCRETAHRQLRLLNTQVEALNEEQRERSQPRPQAHMLADARSLLKSLQWLNLFDVTTRQRRSNGRLRHELVLTRDAAAWRRRRRLDGFGVLVAHPTVKDIVEKDFQVIKSELDLRPVRHRTDPKVQAHVSLCMLALLLQRAMEQQLANGGAPMTAAAATAVLSTCHLNRLQPDGAGAYYTVTRPTPQQRDLIAALGLSRLADDEVVGRSLRPR